MHLSVTIQTVLCCMLLKIYLHVTAARRKFGDKDSRSEYVSQAAQEVGEAMRTPSELVLMHKNSKITSSDKQGPIKLSQLNRWVLSRLLCGSNVN